MKYPKQWKLYNRVEEGSDEHQAIVHAYYHLLRAERGVRAAEGMREMFGSNEFTEYWENVAVENMLAFLAQSEEIPEWQSYIRLRAEVNQQRRMNKMYREVDDPNRQSYPEAERRARRARRKMNARYN